MKKKLHINKETLRVLGLVDLRLAVGGEMAESTGVPCITYICVTNNTGCCWTRGLSCPEWMCLPPTP